MAHAQLDSLLQYIRKVAGHGLASERSDAQLVERFVADRDEAAFAALVERHGALVWGVCSRILNHTQDAEDAFQATFLLLARRAASIRKRGSVASWLYGTAYRVAVRAKADAAERRQRERRVVAMQPVDPNADSVWQDLRPLLDEELNRVPEKYRSPLILCYLQGKTNRQAARELSYSAGSMSWRLAKGRALLRARLIHRGIALPAGLFGTVLAEKVTAWEVPSALLLPTIRAAMAFAAGPIATGSLSPHAAALTEMGLKMIFWTKLKIAMTVVAAVLLFGGSGGLLAYHMVGMRQMRVAAAKDVDRRLPKGKPTSPSSAGPATEAAGERFSLSGTVLDAGGKPVPDADVFLREAPTSWSRQVSPTLHHWHPTTTRNLARTVTDGQGDFAFRDLVLGKLEPLRKSTFPLDAIVTAKGHGLAWLHLHRPDTLPVRFTLPAEAPLQGRLVDPQGKPVALAGVQVLEIAQLDQPIRPPFGSPGYIDLQCLEFPMETKTGPDGRFRLGGLPGDVRVTLRCSADRFLLKEIHAATTDRPQPNIAMNRGPFPADTATPQPVQTGRFTVPLEPGHRLHGHIDFEDTGRPVGGAGVAFRISPPQQTADSHGEFFLNHLPAGKCNFGVYPPGGTDYLGVQAQVDVPGDKWEVQHTVRLPRGAVVAGRVVDEETGEGIAGVHIQYWATPDQAKSLPYPWTTQTQTDGTFRFAVPSGKGKLVIAGVVRGYLTHDYAGSLSDVDPRWVREIGATRNRPLTEVRFALSRGRVVTGRVLAPDGKPVKAEISSRHHLPSNAYRDLNWSADAEGKFTLSGLKPNQTYELVFTNRQLKLAAMVVAQPSEDHKPLALGIRLEPMVAVVGRVADENHHPIPRAIARLCRWQGNHGEVTGDAVRTDAAGLFAFDTLVPGASYSVEATAEGYSSGRDPASCSPPFTAQPGRKNEVADLQLHRLPAK